jgi:Trk-type K+ transport system membrane component
MGPKAINSRTAEGQPGRPPFKLGELWMTTLILKRAPRGLCVMPHFARIFFIAFALVGASCSAKRAQQESERKEISRQLIAAYYSCVRTSFASMLPTMVDRNMGIDQAFMVCRTEESKLQAFEESLSGNPNVSAVAMAAHRNNLKEELLRR